MPRIQAPVPPRNSSSSGSAHRSSSRSTSMRRPVEAASSPAQRTSPMPPSKDAHSVPVTSKEIQLATPPAPPPKTDHQLEQVDALNKHLGSSIRSGTSAALIQFATGSTLLPTQLAELITNLSALARVSLRATAFFIEVILEAARHSTNISLGFTRRALISAVGSARAMHAIAGGELWDPRNAGQAAKGGVRKLGQATNEAFLSVLDRYTALGIYVIHHTFTMAELFAMSGFYLTSTTLQAGIGAADESVRIIDGIFGSNETSRALSGFISLIRRELKDDPNTDGGVGSSVRAIASLTKAFTAFAILQNATYRRSIKGQQTRVLYDCTVLGQVERDTWRARVVGPGSFLKAPGAEAGVAQIEAPSAAAPARPLSSAWKRSSLYAPDDPPAPTSSKRNSRVRTATDNASIMADLDYLVGGVDSEETERQSTRAGPLIAASTRLRHDELPDDIRRTLAQYADADLEGGVVVEREPSNRDEVRRTVRKMSSRGAVETVYEITTETVETVETTTTLERPSRGIAASKSRGLLRIPNPFTSFGGGGGTATQSRMRDTTQSRSGTEQVTHAHGVTEIMTTEEDEWCEVERTAPVAEILQSPGDRLLLSSSEGAGADEEQEVERALPELPNGLPVEGGLVSRDPSDDSRMDVVLRTVKRKFIQKKRVIRQVRAAADDADADADGESREGESRASSPVREKVMIKATGSPSGRAKAQVSQPMDLGSTLARALTKARSTIRQASGSKAPPSPAACDAAMTSSSDLVPSPPRASVANDQVMDTDGGYAGSRAHVPYEGTSATEHDSVRGKKRRMRKGSITSMRSFASRTHTHVLSNTAPNTSSSPNAPGAAESFVGNPFPRQHLVRNLHRFMRYSSGAYGHAFLKIMGLGTSAEYLFANTARHHTNVWSFAHHVGVGVDDILLSSFTEDASAPFHSQKMSPLVNFISVDEESQAIVLTCRGTLGLSDVLTDLTCELEDIDIEGGSPHGSYQVHSGMYASAQRFCSSGSVVHATLKRALEERPDYGLVITGHSLGGGVAALLALLWSSPAEAFREQVLHDQRPIRHPRLTTRFVTSLASGLPAGRPIHAFAFGVPATTSPDLSKHMRGLVTSVVHGNDIVPALSLGTVRDMRNVANMLADERETDVAREIVSRVIGFYQRRRAAKRVGGAEEVPRLAAGAESLPFDEDMPRPQEAPRHEREQTIELSDLVAGHTGNRATQAGYSDPGLSDDRRPATAAAEQARAKSGGRGSAAAGADEDEDHELNDWLWSLIRTMRANMNEAKLYPPGQVFCVESFEVFVTPRMSATSSLDADRLATSRGQAHRVILRECADVEKRFSEPVFSRSMLRDHIPTNYELCTQLLYDSIIAPMEAQADTTA